MIYESHLIRNLLAHIAITLGAIILLVWLSQVMKLAFVIELGSSAEKFLLLTFSALPTICLTIIPIATAIGCYGQLSFLNSDRELIALSSTGLTNFEIAKPAIRVALVISMIAYIFSFYIAPKSYHYLKNSLSNFRNNFIANVIHEKSFNQLSKNITLYIDSKNSRGNMQEIILFDNRNTREATIIFAKKGILSLQNNIPAFKLYNGVRQVIDRRGNMNQMTFENFTIKLPQANAERVIAAKNVQEYTFLQLLFPDKSIGERRLKAVKLERHQRIIWPAYTFAFVMITFGLFLKSPHKRTEDYKSGLKIISVLVLGLYIHFSFFNLSSINDSYIIFCYLNLLGLSLFGYRLLKTTTT